MTTPVSARIKQPPWVEKTEGTCCTFLELCSGSPQVATASKLPRNRPPAPRLIALDMPADNLPINAVKRCHEQLARALLADADKRSPLEPFKTARWQPAAPGQKSEIFGIFVDHGTRSASCSDTFR